MAARVITQHYANRFREVGLRSTQFIVLAAVDEAGPVAMTKLADILVMDRTTLNRDLQPLKRDGLVSITQGRDRRVRLIDLTDLGRAKLEAGYPLWRELQNDFYGALGKKRWKSLMKDLSHATKTAQKS